ncbi:MAG: CPBP family intramembrane metalloprotease [Planctomycetota bacterium]|nr:MAG: CPBP family intramembrane metalloprotease [Planctomycetota bacterium]
MVVVAFLNYASVVPPYLYYTVYTGGLMVPGAIAWRVSSAGCLADVGLSWENISGQLRDFVLGGVVLLGSGALIFHLFFKSFHHYYIFSLPRGSNLFYLLYVQVVLVAFPEEFLFRGYLQARLMELWGSPVGAVLGSAGIFAFCHLVFQGWMGGLVFFPALVFGWLRQRTGSIFPSTFLHGLANVELFLFFGR